MENLPRTGIGIRRISTSKLKLGNWVIALKPEPKYHKNSLGENRNVFIIIPVLKQ